VLCALQNVETQLELWENETRRVQQQQATYYSKFEDHELFNATLHTAQGHNSVLWFKQDPNPEGSFIVIKRSGEGVGSREGGISVSAGRDGSSSSGKGKQDCDDALHKAGSYPAIRAVALALSELLGHPVKDCQQQCGSDLAGASFMEASAEESRCAVGMAPRNLYQAATGSSSLVPSRLCWKRLLHDTWCQEPPGVRLVFKVMALQSCVEASTWQLSFLVCAALLCPAGHEALRNFIVEYKRQRQQHQM
jgi:hypothetical protein